MVKYRIKTTIWNRKVDLGDVLVDNDTVLAEGSDLVVPCEFFASAELVNMLEELFWSYAYSDQVDIQTRENV